MLEDSLQQPKFGEASEYVDAVQGIPAKETLSQKTDCEALLMMPEKIPIDLNCQEASLSPCDKTQVEASISDFEIREKEIRRGTNTCEIVRKGTSV